ncbi:archaeosortase/exosortase family protein [Verrucomicrobium spinosum]|uniref:archaeosortase/exosortase family protein n=1 Tax=Verrucomicrobium spinosum TaxID=2736 RepID=UPI0001745126|nr:archaeosortase/exosortase family protein [Verrucomicrobium spinosum]
MSEGKVLSPWLWGAAASLAVATGGVGYFGEDRVSGIVAMAMVKMLNVAGVPIIWEAGNICVGHLRVPWSVDCAGFATLYVLMAAAAANWVLTRNVRTLAIQMAVSLPLAFVLNVLRVAAILGYRWMVWPRVETPQLHYLLGFLLVLPPMMAFLSVQRPAGRQSRWMAAVFLAAVFSLITVRLPEPGGLWVTLAALSALAARMAGRDFRTTLEQRLTVIIWSVGGLWIAWSSMESLWLPWLMLSPWGGFCFWRSLVVPVLAFLCIPVVAGQPWSIALFVVAACAAAWEMRGGLRKSGGPGMGALAGVDAPVKIRQACLATVFFVLPFVSQWWTSDAVGGGPPKSLHPIAISPAEYQIRLSNSPRDIRIDWLGPQGGGRHHTLMVCAAYRGLQLKPTPSEPEVVSTGEVLYREYFLMGSEVVSGYGVYLKRTFWPGSSPGIHLIFSARASSYSPGQFAQITDGLAARIREHSMSADEAR